MSVWNVSEAASRDLRDIYFYSRDQFGLSQTEKYLDTLERQFDRLAENPLLGRRYDLDTDHVMRFVHRSHVIFYERTGEGILILRILHQAMDPVRRL